VAGVPWGVLKLITPNTIASQLLRRAIARWNARDLVGLRGTGRTLAIGVADALDDALRHRLSTSERAVVERIETLRSEIEQSRERIEFVDYGAGSATKRRTTDEKHRGSTATATVGDVARSSAKRYFWALVLFEIIRECRPVRCLELGTNLGLSAAFQAAALALNGSGTLVTLEGAAPLAALARTHWQRLGLRNIESVVGRFQDTLDGALRDHAPIDYAFIDGHHDGPATLAYFDRIYAYTAAQSIIVFDDIRWSAGMRRAWASVTEDARVQVSITLRNIGIALVDRDQPNPRARFELWIV